MKKHFILLFVFAMLVGACAQPTPEPTKPPPPPPPEPTNTPVPPTPTPEPTLPPVVGGPRVVFVSNRGDDPDKTDLYVLDMETQEITSLNTGFDAVVFPQWSPDGRKILFAVRDVWNLYTIAPDGSDLTQVTAFRSNNADWSPDGSKIVFQSDHDNEPTDTPDIYTVDANGENLVELIDEPEFADFNPRWAGSGQIMFLSNRTGSYEVFLINEDGSDVTQVTEGKSPITVLPFPQMVLASPLCTRKEDASQICIRLRRMAHLTVLCA